MKKTTASILFLCTWLLSTATGFAEDKPVHLFILSGQSNMQGMNPETGFLPEANKLFNGDEVVYIKVAKGGQPICRWLEEWTDIAEKKGLLDTFRTFLRSPTLDFRLQYQVFGKTAELRVPWRQLGLQRRELSVGVPQQAHAVGDAKLEALISSCELAWRMQNNDPGVLDLSQEIMS